MPDSNELDSAGSFLARRILFITLWLALGGAGLGVFGVSQGGVTGTEALLASCSLLFSIGSLLTLMVFRGVALQSIATAATYFFLANLSAGTVISVYGHGDHLNLFVYLIWFFPLLVFNKLVNTPSRGHHLSKVLSAAPLVLITCLLPRWIVVLRTEQQMLLFVYCFSFSCYASTIGLVTRYREKYIVERERVESLKIEGSILESISDCFISLNEAGHLVYLNDSACTELGLDRKEALGQSLSAAAPSFLSDQVLAELKSATSRGFSSFFEVISGDARIWYDIRCFPRPDGLSIYFRNITKSMLSRLVLEEANKNIGKQAEFLDKAQDAIYVCDSENRVTYWNKGAERLYGWPAQEVLGRVAADIFGYRVADMNQRRADILRDREWVGELRQKRSDGSELTVQSHCTVVEEEEGGTTSILVINTDITKRKADEARIEHLAFYDVLTELPNRQLLRDKLAEAISTVAIQHRVGVLLYIDLDDFNTLNDTMGHDVGDVLLCQVASRLTDCLGPLDVVARPGGDEFVVMLSETYDDVQSALAAGYSAVEKITSAFRLPFALGNYESETKASLGGTLFYGYSNIDQLMKEADLAMYCSKARGGDGFSFFETGMQTDIANRAALLADLRRALPNGEFQLHYQPQLDSSATVIGSEALLRWVHPVRGRVPPDKFIPLAEEAGLIVEVGRWVLETACRQMAAWATLPAMAGLTLAVNVSVRQFVDPHFVDLVRETLRATGANPQRLKLEITESSTMEKIDDVIAVMASLKSEGVSFSLDDFGTGYSSLSHLQHLPLDQLKIDRSFVNRVLTHPKDASIARTIIVLARSLGLSVIAEGVETEAQRAFLEAEGCHLYQGFLYSPAIHATVFEEFVVANVASAQASTRSESAPFMSSISATGGTSSMPPRNRPEDIQAMDLD